MRRSKSSLFLMELVIVILFFALSSAVCIQLFVKAHTLDQETVNMNHSVIWIQNLSESFLAFDGDMDQVKELYKDKDACPDPGSLILYFDRDWSALDPDAAGNAAFEAAMQLSKLPGSDPGGSASAQPDPDRTDGISGGYTLEADITITPLDTHTPLYTQHIEHYVPRKGGSTP